MEAWLKDLPMFYQPESTCALQNKAIAAHQGPWPLNEDDEVMAVTAGGAAYPAAADEADEINDPSASHASDDEERTYSATLKARCQVRRLQRRAHVISTEFAQLCS